jgi:hypothetical protein
MNPITSQSSLRNKLDKVRGRNKRKKKGNCIKNQTSGKKKIKYSGPIFSNQINLQKIAVKTFTLQQLEYLGGNRS